MGQHKMEDTRWLSLSEAARRLDVHPTTLRRWADEGQIPVMLTPGGHRRFAASDIAEMSESRHSVRRLGPVERIWANQALEHTRRQIMGRRNDQWLERHDERTREHHRRLGQNLMSLTLQYLTAEDDSDELLVEARRIGNQYGASARSMGLRLTDALRASMFFRDTLVSTAVLLPENVRIPAGSQARLLERINAVLNTVQLAVAEEFDSTGAARGGN